MSLLVRVRLNVIFKNRYRQSTKECSGKELLKRETMERRRLYFQKQISYVREYIYIVDAFGMNAWMHVG